LAIDTLDDRDIVAFRDWRQSQVKRVKLRNSSLNAVLVGVADLMNFSVDKLFIRRKDVPVIPYLPREVDKDERSEFTLAEYNRLRRVSRKRIQEARNRRNRRERQLLDLCIGIMASTGIRTGEMMALRWDDCTPALTLRGRKTCEIFILGNEIKEGRNITPPPRVWRWIKMLREIGGQPDDQPLMPWGDCEKSFTSLLNDPRLATGQRSMKTDRKGNRRILYSLRHSYAIWEAKRGYPMEETCRLMGHKLYIHHRIYARVAVSEISRKRVT